jgi:hypothetical protein
MIDRVALQKITKFSNRFMIFQKPAMVKSFSSHIKNQINNISTINPNFLFDFDGPQQESSIICMINSMINSIGDND